jgi:uncharacterized protein (DUF433 family)
MVLVTHSPTHVGVGLYSLAEAARLLKIHHSKIQRWTKPDDGLFPRYFDPAEHTLTFLELMELQFIKMFRSEGVALQAIRKASEAAAKKFRTAYPLCVKRFDTDGTAIFATLIDKQTDAESVEDLRHGQLVFGQIVKPFFRKLEYDGQIEPSRYWPMDKSGRIVLDPARQFGKPIDAQSGVPVSTMIDALNAGEDAPSVAKWFDIPLAAVKAAIDFEKSLAM